MSFSNEDYTVPLAGDTTKTTTRTTLDTTNLTTVDESITSRDDVQQRSRDNSISSLMDMSQIATLPEAERNVILPPSPLYKIVLTGGPCGGKTTALARLSSYLRERGFEVLTCPEAYTILASNGMSLSYYETEGMPGVIQNTVMDVQMNLEDGFERVLRARGKPAVLLCDRGLMDGSAYMTRSEWKDLLLKRKVSNVCELREGRYNAVFHVVTAAEGAAQYYTLENNEARTETPELARELDEKTRKAWVGHPNLRVFDNSTNFEGKLRRLVEATAKLVGLPCKLSRVTTKFLLRCKPDLKNFPVGVDYHVFDVEKIYLYDVDSRRRSWVNWYGSFGDSDNILFNAKELEQEETHPTANYVEEYSFVRKRTQLEINPETKEETVVGSVYGQTTVKRTNEKQNPTIEVKRIITKREYNAACKTRDQSRHVVKQKRISFLWNMQSFTVHMYEEPVKDLCILHAQVEVPDDEDKGGSGDVGVGKRCGLMNSVDLPPFLEIERPLNDTKKDKSQYGAFNISLKRT